MAESTNSALIDAVAMPVLVVGPEGRIALANRAARVAFGAATGQPLLSLFRQPPLIAAMETVQSGAGMRRIELGLAVDGAETARRVTLAPLPGERGISVVMSFEDPGDSDRADAIRRDFVANVSHELRTPLTALIGHIDTLQGAAREDPKARERFLAVMAGEAARMNRLVGDLLSLSRVEAEERRRPDGIIDLRQPMRAALAALAPLAGAEGVVLTVTGDEASIGLRADADQMTQVFANLCENAIRHGGKDREVTVNLCKIAHDAGLRGPAIAAEVADRGQGIDPIHLPRLTERFYRVDPGRSRASGGTGLGLAIVKHIVTRHRGRLGIESRKGEGSRFTVYLPLE